MLITLLHTAKDHCATFDNLRDRISPGTKLVHVVRPDFLARAQGGLDDALAKDIAKVVQSATGPVLCTCTTIGAAAQSANAIRIDAPMMQAAAQVGGPTLLVCCLESTRAPSRQLLQGALTAEGSDEPVYELCLGEFWPLFEAGEAEAFRAVVAGAVKAYFSEHPELSAIVLAQASMAGAAAMLADLPVPVFSSPELALRAMIG